jgi:prolyl oligopeptidase
LTDSRLLTAGLLAAALVLRAATGTAQQPAYPPAPPGTVVDNYFGRRVADPYRPLEDLASSATKAWVVAENRLTFGYLDRLPQRDSIRARLTALWDYPRVDVPVHEAGKLWFRRNSGLERQSALYRTDPSGAHRTLVLDPNALSPDGSVAVGQWSVSPNGRLLAYSTAAGGSDLRDIRVRDLRAGRDLAEVVARVKFSGIAWTRDAKGFYYSRFGGSAESANLSDANTHHQLWYHPLGGGGERLVFERSDDSTATVSGTVSDDGRWLFIVSGRGTTNNRLWLVRLGNPRRPDLAAKPMPVTTAEDAIYRPLGMVGDTLYLYTNWQAERGRIVAATVGDSARAHWRTLVAEGPDAMHETLLVGSRFVVAYLRDVLTRLRLFDITGAPRASVTLPDEGTASGLSGRTDGKDFFFAFSSYLRPTAVYRFDLASGTLQPVEPAPSPFDASPYETRATFYRSRDGTQIPIFVMARKDLAREGRHPTILYGYGGFNISILPSYSPAVAAWLELGGVYAVANLRGGGEYGEAWHRAAMRERKQNVFDDFAVAAEFLVREGYATPRTLALQGRSNGGLLVGALMTQHPALFSVALPAVGVMDMLRYQKFTGGRLWAEEYGSSDDSTAVPYLLAYSPLQNLKPGTCYPATLVTTADHDDRVQPGHSFKFTAALQAAQSCDRPVLIRVETGGSHGYRPTDRLIAEIADQLAFALANLATPCSRPPCPGAGRESRSPSWKDRSSGPARGRSWPSSPPPPALR